MRRITAGELVVGDVFYREVYRPPDPATDTCYRVRAVRFAPLRGYFGEVHDMVHVDALSELLGPRVLDLGVGEAVWLRD